MVARGSACILALCGWFLCGCSGRDLRDYEPAGQGADAEATAALSARLPSYFVGLAGGSEEDLEEAWRTGQSIIDEHLMDRPSSPGFRSLCALMNTYLTQWDRLLVLERLSFAGNEYAFAVIAMQSGQVRAVTNMERPDEGGVGNETLSLRSPPIHRRKVVDALADLDAARKVLPKRLLWFNNVDWPLYIVHDVKAGGSAFSFGICGWGNGANDGHGRSQVAVDYAQAAELVNRAKPWRAVPDDSPRASELRAAGQAYATLLARVWESILGKADFYILGPDPEAAGPIPIQNAPPGRSAK